MTTQEIHEKAGQENTLAGFATVDDRGRVALPKATRQALQLHTGSSVAYIVVDGAIMLIPQDAYLAEMAERAAGVLRNAGLTVDDILAELPAVRAEIIREEYGDAFVDGLVGAHAALPDSRS